MPPALLILGLGNRRRIPIPFPLFLLWPLMALAWLALTLCQLFVRTGRDAKQAIGTAKHAVAVFRHLSGLRIDVESKDGSGIHLQII